MVATQMVQEHQHQQKYKLRLNELPKLFYHTRMAFEPADIFYSSVLSCLFCC